MLEFTDPDINAIDESVVEVTNNGVWHLVADDLISDGLTLDFGGHRVIN